ncbi:hypothetical protein OF83DRAFT_1228665 [Amylostereum chailletii]|nr:hypothetical protein OF83DRAFT_1228665 [Amylostereum chailletii]
MPLAKIQRSAKLRTLPCKAPGCRQWFKNVSGQTQHFNARHAINLLPAPAPRIVRHRIPTPIPANEDGDFDPTMPGLEDDDDDYDDYNYNDYNYNDHDNNAGGVYMGARAETHPHLDGRPCNSHGAHLPVGSPPPAPSHPPADDYSPFNNREEFEIGDFLYRQDEMSGANVDKLMALWASTLHEGEDPPFASNKDMQETIDASKLGDVVWQSFKVTYNGPLPAGEVPPWMLASYEVWFRCPLEVLRIQLSNPDFASEMDFCVKRVYDAKNKRHYRDFMSGDWGWKQLDILAEDPRNHGATFCPVISGSDKTTVSVATGQHDYYPFYLSNGLITNRARRAHREGISLVAFLSIPKTDEQFHNDSRFRMFHRQLFYSSLHMILQPLRSGMTDPVVMLCADGHYRRIIFGLGPYIADYPEQVMLACIVQNWCPKCTARPSLLDGPGMRRCAEHTDAVVNALGIKAAWENYGIVGEVKPFTDDFPRADIHELLSPDLLHQIIKGTFKDHLVGWVNQYLVEEHGQSRASAIVADIDRRIAAALSFPGLRCFPEGRGFKQWTGDDSKALMKVYLPAIAGHVPGQMVRALSAFLEFCYLVRRSTIDEDTLDTIDGALAHFHLEREIFRDVGVRPDGFSLPRQHSMVHYVPHIRLLGAPNGLCSSITESKHIKAVKDPYQWTNRNEPLGQMLLINQRLDKLAAVRVDFTAREMLNGPCLGLPPIVLATVHRDALAPAPAPIPIADPIVLDEEGNVDDNGGDVDGPVVMGEVQLAKCRVRHLPRPVDMLATTINIPHLQELIRRFLYDRQFPDSEISPVDAALASCPHFDRHVTVFPSAVAIFYAPSDLSGIGGMHCERIRSTASWRHGPARRDCVFLEKDPDVVGFRGLYAARVLLFFQFTSDGVDYPCALVSWFSPISETPCPDTGMWIVEPDLDRDGDRELSVIHIDCILRGAHLIGVSAGAEFLPRSLSHTDSLDVFRAFYVNKYADYHSHEIAF